MSARRGAAGSAADDAWPDGLAGRHNEPRRGWRKHASKVGVAALAVVMLWALSGLAGVEETTTAEADTATAIWHAPSRIRNGEFFEMRLAVEAHDRIDELVVGVDLALWEDFTINTLFPAPSEETTENGELQLTFGPIEPGTTFEMKVDAQINPDMLWRNDGVVTVSDGDERILEIPVVIEVLP